MNQLRSRFAIPGLLVTTSIALPSNARAQSSVTMVPSVSVSSIYDGNVVGQGSGDQMLWLTPRLEGQVTTPTVTVMGSYAFDMQRAIDHPTLNEFEARRQALLFDLARVWLELGIAYQKRRGQAWIAVERRDGRQGAHHQHGEH